nr:protein FAR-RED IMPAIRED RESPONSE 1-like [Ipomoea batatas]
MRSSKHEDDGNFKYFTFACAKAHKKESTSKNLLSSKLSTKTRCQAKIRCKRCEDESFKITIVELSHDHDLSPGKVRHLRCHRKLNEQVKRRLDINDQAGIAPNKNFRSLVVDAVRRKRLGVGDAEAVCKYFAKMQQSDPNFFYVMDVDEDSRLRNSFWADGRSKAAYESFADVITFDTTYLTNKYDMPFSPFVGVNHHGQSALFGCGLLSTEDSNSFVWLFQSWLNCMSGRHPKAIITDQCKAMQNAIAIVFPNTKHRWCLWHIMKKLLEKLRGYSKYEEIKEALQSVVYDSLNENEFENGWSLLIDTFDLNENDWLDGLYKERQRWQYEKALESKVEKEKEADIHSFNSMYECLSNYEIEKQFQRLYTNEKFREFQEE